jgi:prophage regulatory protein
MTERVLSTREVMEVTSLGRTTLWRLEREGEFPARRRLIGHRVGWLQSEVDGWLQGRPVVVGGGRDAT